MRILELSFALALILGCNSGKPATEQPSSPSPAQARAGAPVAPALVTRPAADAPAGGTTGCLEDRGGCRAGFAAVPRCPPGTAALALGDLLKDRKRWKGKKVAVRGPLDHSAGGCTEMGCVNTQCCNSCTGAVTLGSWDPQYKASLLLRSGSGDSEAGDAVYDCEGDESLVCCKYEAKGEEVVATGTLTNLNGGSPPDPRLYVLAGATICRP
jgi:hypothetical protein